MNLKIHHVGIVCKNIEKAVRDYQKLYIMSLRFQEVVHDDLQHADLCILKTDTGLDVEFISGKQVTNLQKAKITYLSSFAILLKISKKPSLVLGTTVRWLSPEPEACCSSSEESV